MKHILVPTDFSPSARNAFRYALYIANEYGARISTVHISDPLAPLKSYLPEGLLEKLNSEVALEFQQYKQEAAILRQSSEHEQLTAIQVDHILREGDFVPEITKVIEDEKIDFIVMGTQGANNLTDVFWGSNTTKLINNATCPLLVVPEDSKYKGLKQICYATGIDWFEDPSIGKALDFAKYFNSYIHCFNVQKSGNAKYEQALKRMEDYRYEFRDEINIKFEVVNSRDPLIAINNYIAEKNADMLCMLYHKKGIIAELLFSNHVKNMALGGRIPLLVFQENIEI